MGLGAAVFKLATAFLFVFPAAGLGAVVDFGLGFLGPSIFLVEVTLGCEGASVNLLRRGFSILWSGGKHAPSDDVIAALAKDCLLLRGPGLMGFRSGGLAFGGTLPDTLFRSLSKGCPRFFPLNTAPVTRCVVDQQAQH